MTCAEIDNLVTPYVECALPRELMRNLYGHLWRCEDCRTHLNCYRKVIELLREERRIQGAAGKNRTN